MFVLTIDQAKSRKNDDRVPTVLELLANIPTLARFERTVGDEIQGVPRNAAAALAAIRLCVRDGHWHCGLGIGAGNYSQDVHHRSSEATGEAFYAARKAVETSKRRTPSVAAKVPIAPDLEEHIDALLSLKMHVIAQRTPRQWEVIDALQSVGSRANTAELLGISRSAVSQSLAASAWEIESATDQLLIDLLNQAHAREEQ